MEGAITRAYLLNNEEGAWKDQMLHMEYSASGKLHIDIRIPLGMTIREAQQAYCEALGVAFDEDCCTPERMIYITDQSQRLYLSENWYAELPEAEVKARRQAYLDRGLTIDGQAKLRPCRRKAKMPACHVSRKISRHPTSAKFRPLTTPTTTWASPTSTSSQN